MGEPTHLTDEGLEGFHATVRRRPAGGGDRGRARGRDQLRHAGDAEPCSATPPPRSSASRSPCWCRVSRSGRADPVKWLARWAAEPDLEQSRFLDLTARRRDGHEMPVEVRVRAGDIAGRPRYFITVRDNTFAARSRTR